MSHLLFSIFLILSPLRGEVLKNEVSRLSRKNFSYKEVCTKMKYKHLLMVEALDATHLDCMGNTIAAIDFCKNEFSKSKKLLRGYISQKTKEVVCEQGRAVILSIGCDKKHKKYCANPKTGCLELGKIFAYSLKLNHFSLIEKDVDNVLNCFYETTESTDLNDQLKDPLEGKI